MIKQILVAHPTNIKPKTMEALENYQVPVATFAGLHGSMVHVLDDITLERKLIKQTDLAIITSIARSQGCSWVYFDHEALPLANAPSYQKDWAKQPDPGLLMY